MRRLREQEGLTQVHRERFGKTKHAVAMRLGRARKR